MGAPQHTTTRRSNKDDFIENEGFAMAAREKLQSINSVQHNY